MIEPSLVQFMESLLNILDVTSVVPVAETRAVPQLAKLFREAPSVPPLSCSNEIRFLGKKVAPSPGKSGPVAKFYENSLLLYSKITR